MYIDTSPNEGCCPKCGMKWQCECKPIGDSMEQKPPNPIPLPKGQEGFLCPHCGTKLINGTFEGRFCLICPKCREEKENDIY